MNYEIEDQHVCPKCTLSPLHSRDCTNIHCEEGEIDMVNVDAINFMEGEQYETCQECFGIGVERWCPSCGYIVKPHDKIDHPDYSDDRVIDDIKDKRTDLDEKWDQLKDANMDEKLKEW